MRTTQKQQAAALAIQAKALDPASSDSLGLLATRGIQMLEIATGTTIDCTMNEKCDVMDLIKSEEVALFLHSHKQRLNRNE